MATASDIREFNGYLRNCTNAQVVGVCKKEHEAGRDDYAELAKAEAERREILIDWDWLALVEG